MRNDVLVLGGPGSGKDTQAERISDEYGIPKLDAGDTLRKYDDVLLHNRPDDERHGLYVSDDDGKPVRIADADGPQDLPEYQKTIGQWLPDPPHAETTAYLTSKELGENPEYAEGVVFSGYPRTLEQAQLMEDIPVDPSAIIVLDVSLDEAVNRLTERERDDDTPEQILDRQAWQYAQLNRIQAYYREQDGDMDDRFEWVWSEDADQDEETVWETVNDIVDDALYKDDTR